MLHQVLLIYETDPIEPPVIVCKRAVVLLNEANVHGLVVG
jgi:hypothetical protein